MTDPASGDTSDDLNPYLNTDYNQGTLTGSTADEHVSLAFGSPDSFYDSWDAPDTVIADITGALSESETPGICINRLSPHVSAWTDYATPGTSLWMIAPGHVQTEIFRELTNHGWDDRTRLTWVRDRDVTPQPPAPEPASVTTVCTRYVLPPNLPDYSQGTSLTDWIRGEWGRTGISNHAAIEECNLDYPVRRLLTTENTVTPPFEVVDYLRDYANQYGRTDIDSYFEINGEWSRDWWESVTPTFCCDADLTALWDDVEVPPEDVTTSMDAVGMTVPPRVPVSVWRRLIEMTTDSGEMVWVPFAGHGRACVAAKELGRECRGAVDDRTAYRGATQLLDDAVFGRGSEDTQASFTDFSDEGC